MAGCSSAPSTTPSGVATSATSNDQAAPPTTQADFANLAPIQSLKDLQRQPLVQLSQGGGVRLGIGPLDPDLGPWRIVYCRVEPGSTTRPASDRRLHNGSTVLGPLQVNCVWEDEQDMIADDLVSIDFATPRSSIFHAIVPLTRSDKATIHVMQDDGRELASCTFDVPKAIPDPWRAFSKDNWNERNDKNKPAYRVDPSRAGVIPNLPEQIGDDDLLMPKADGLKLSLTDHAFHVDAGTATMQDDDTLIARWWLNGKLQPSDPTAKASDRADARQVSELHTIDVAFGLPADLLSAKPGDKIAVQVLYSGAGWDYFNGLLQADALRNDTTGWLLSNRLEFVLTADQLQTAKHSAAMARSGGEKIKGENKRRK
jgi:hypothetical protein